MSSVLYYSSMCQHSTQLLGILAKSSARKDMHFVSVDKRERTAEGKVNVIMSNGSRLPLPPNVTKVPALLLLNRGSQVLFGSDILEYIRPIDANANAVAQRGNGEPMAFALGDGGSGFGVASDQYSFLDQSAQSMTAKGDGGMRQLHSYATIDAMDTIETPPDTYKADTIGEGALEQIQSTRNNQFPRGGPPNVQ